MEYDRLIALGLYQGALAKQIKDLKIGGQKMIGWRLGRKMAKLKLPVADLIVPVPVDLATKRRRGFNQSLLIAKAMGAALRLPVRQPLSKCRKTIPQAVLPPLRRATNVKGCFMGKKVSLKGKRVLLVDDMAASGSTLNDAARALKAMGAAKVYAVVAAKSKNYAIMRKVIAKGMG